MWHMSNVSRYMGHVLEHNITTFAVAAIGVLLSSFNWLLTGSFVLLLGL